MSGTIEYRRQTTVSKSGPSSLLTNLVAFYPLQESAGDTAEESTNNFDGTYHSNVLQQTGPGSFYAVEFDSNTDYISLPENLRNEFSTIFSISCWVKFDTLSIDKGSDNYLVNIGSNGTSSGIRLSQQNLGTNRLGIWMWDIDVNNYDVQYTISNTTTFMHIVATCPGVGGYLKLYIDSNLVATDTELITSGVDYKTYTNCTIGNMASSGFGTDGLDGKICLVGLWDKELTTNEISALYNSGNGLNYPF